MDWNAAVEQNCQALKRIVAVLLAMVARSGGMPTLARYDHRAILRLLRPAEAAARRLIVVLARGLKVPAHQPRSVATASRLRPTILRNGVGTGIILPPGASACVVAAAPAAAHRALAFALLDPLPRPAGIRRLPPWAAPRISTPGWSQPFATPQPPSPDDPIDATRLGRRLVALAAALDDLPAQASRLARWRARNDFARARGLFRRASPLRSGPPPGGRRRGKRRRPLREIDHLLARVHGLAFWALEPTNTS